MKPTDSSLTRARRLVLRIHGTALLLMTPIFAVIITIGYATGSGMYGMLQSQPLAFGGFWQAYWIMFAIGGALWFGSYTDRPRLFHLVGAMAHIGVFTAIILFPAAWAPIGNIWLISAWIHIIGISVELIAFFWPSKQELTGVSRA